MKTKLAQMVKHQKNYIDRGWEVNFVLIFHNAILDDFQIEHFATKTMDIALVNYDGCIFLPYFGPKG